MPNRTATSLDSAAPERAAANAVWSFLNTSSMRVLALVVLFSAAALHEAFTLSALNGLDVWSHLRTGIWILQNHAAPHSGLFSPYPDTPWIVGAWGFDALLAALYRLMALRALPVLLMVFKVALALAFLLLARDSRQSFWVAVLLVAAVQYAMPGLQLQPALCSILLFAIELWLLLEARRTGHVRLLWWLPLLFCIWANLDTGFVYGLLVLILFLAVVSVEAIGRLRDVRWLAEQGQTMPPGITAAVTAASFLATLLTPYTYNVYGIALKHFTRSPLLAYLPELGAVGFRRPQDYALLLLAMLAFFSIGYRRSRDLFLFALMAVCLLLSFPAQRDSWLVAVASVAVIGDAFKPAEQKDTRLGKPERLVTAGLVFAVLLAAVIARVPSSRDALLARVGRTLPVRACDYIRDNHLQGPVFNAYEWGSFLTWYLPDYAITIDSRNDLYGDEITLGYFKLTHAEVPLSRDVSFVYARTILLQRKAPMAVALSATPAFKVVYQDDLATILVPQHQ